ncbi:MAG: SLC13 family permease [Anaerolineales bacterium]|nr:SLC13 family permease [Anaerolineales bacterium]
MSTEIILTLSILGFAVILFITEWLRADLVALLTLSVLAITGLVNAEETLSGFSSPAVVTIWAVFILSAGLTRTGVAAWLGRQVLRLSGDKEIRTLLILMVVSALLSAFMNNVGVTALLLPVVLDICRRIGRPASRILLPLAFSSLLGGMTTMIGTPSNILVSDILVDFGYQPFTLFDFAPFGAVVTLAGILYLSTFGRRLLPHRDMTREFQQPDAEASDTFAIEERMFVITLPANTRLDGCTLGRSRLGSVLGLNVIAVIREGHTNLGPNPETVLRSGDRLLVTGRADYLLEWNKGPQFTILSYQIPPEYLTSDEVMLAEAVLPPGSPLVSRNLEQLHFRQQYGGVVLAIWRDGRPIHYQLESIVLKPDDKLLMLISRRQAETLNNNSSLTVAKTDAARYELEKSLSLIRIPPKSHLVGYTIADSHLGDAYRMGVMGIMRDHKMILMPVANEKIMTGDQLLVRVNPETIATLESLHELIVDTEAHPQYEDMESDTVGLLEVAISPQSSLPGKTLREIHFREKYGLSVLAIWRGGTTHRSGLRDYPLRFGDALLVFGPRERLRLLASEPDFIPLREEAQLPPRLKKAPIAAGLMLAVIITVSLGIMPIAVAAISGGALMVLTGSLHMDEAYRAIEWKAVFLIAGMLPLGIAMQTSGTAQFLASEMIRFLQPYGTQALIAGLFLLTALASQVMPNPVITVLMAPVALTTARDLGLSPYALAMVVVVAATSSFLSPVGHPTNILVMGPGGYKFSDYIKTGLPLVLIILALTVFVLPIFWPL